jgi:hypothetical protein
MNIIKVWNDRSIRFREDGYVCLTDMAQAANKRVNNWIRLDSTKEYIEVLSAVTLFRATELIQVTQGGTPEEQGTWAHRKIAIRFAQWCSAKFAVQVDAWTEELLEKGTVSILTKQANREALERQFQPEVPLRSIEELAAILGKRFGAAYEQRVLQQNIKKFHPYFDLPILEPEEKVSVSSGERLLTPTQIASELGFAYKTGNPNPQKVNKLLESLGYQQKIGNSWSPTEKAIAAKLCDRKPVDTNSRTQKDQLLWSERILVVLSEHSQF